MGTQFFAVGGGGPPNWEGVEGGLDKGSCARAIISIFPKGTKRKILSSMVCAERVMHACPARVRLPGPPMGPKVVKNDFFQSSS